MSATPTLTAALDAAAGVAGAGFSHLVAEGDPVRDVSYAQLAERARRVGAALLESGLKRGDRVGLILPDSVDFIDAIFGAMYAGLIAVPIYPPMHLGRLELYLANTAHILRRAGCRLVVTERRVRSVLGRLMGEVPGLRGVEDLQSLVQRVDAGAAPRVDVRPDDVAFLQFTSGSTALPKGVTLTHANVLANVDGIGAALGLRWPEPGPGLSWLPLYHDMGLIGVVFGGVRFALSNILFIAPLVFLKRPAIWLRQLSERRTHRTFAPNFAYGLAASRVKDHEIEGIDLSELRVAGCGGEPVQHDTLLAFARRYEPRGFRRSAFLPCYGMAEHTLAISFTGLEEEPRTDRVDPAALAEGEARPSDAADALAITCCGRSVAGHELRITDADGHPLPEGRVGHIELRGPSVMRGYWDDPERTAEVLRDGWLSTGDLGYVKAGEIYICGRLKDLIIVNGRNYYPSDLEAQASQVEGVRRGNVVAFGLPGAPRERVVVAAEVRADDASIREAIAARILEALSLRVDEVLLLPPGSLPKTSSGKLQRRRTVELYQAGALGRVADAPGALGLLKHLAASRWGYVKASLARRPESDDA